MDSCTEDVPSLAHWWSNCLHLRWMLWAMCRGGGDEGNDMEEFSLVTQVQFDPSPSLCSLLNRACLYVCTPPLRLINPLVVTGVPQLHLSKASHLRHKSKVCANQCGSFLALHTAPVL